MAKKTHEDLKELLNQVPGVKEHLNKHSVIMGREILKRRIEKGYTQEKIVELIREQGESINQATLSKIESGHDSITSRTYDKVLRVLGELEDINLKYKESPRSKELVKSR